MTVGGEMKKVGRRYSKHTIFNNNLVLRDQDNDEGHLQYMFHVAWRCQSIQTQNKKWARRDHIVPHKLRLL